MGRSRKCLTSKQTPRNSRPCHQPTSLRESTRVNANRRGFPNAIHDIFLRHLATLFAAFALSGSASMTRMVKGAGCRVLIRRCEYGADDILHATVRAQRTEAPEPGRARAERG